MIHKHYHGYGSLKKTMKSKWQSIAWSFAEDFVKKTFIRVELRH